MFSKSLVNIKNKNLMNIKNIGRTASTISIGGAGTFDGIFLTGVLAVMLVAIT